METPSTRVLHPPGGGTSISISGGAAPADRDMVSPVSKREAADKRNKSSIFEDGDRQNQRCVRKERAGDESRDNIFGSTAASPRPTVKQQPAPQSPNYRPSSVFDEPPPPPTANGASPRFVKDYMKSNIFSADDSAGADNRRSQVKNYQKSSIFGDEQPNAQAQGISPRRAGSAKPKGNYNPITGAAYEAPSGGGAAPAAPLEEVAAPAETNQVVEPVPARQRQPPGGASTRPW